jgi:CRP-like cAMP-binding protein
MADNKDALLMRLASHVNLFSGMPRTALERLIARADRVTERTDKFFFDEGEMGASFYVVVMGKVVVEKRSGSHWIELNRLKPGDTFGEMSLLDEKYRSARVRALELTVCLRFPGRGLDDSPDVQAVIYKNMARMLAQRLKANNTEVASFKAEKIETAAAATAESTAKMAEAAAAAESTAKKPEMETGGFMSRGDERSHLRKT